MATSNEPIFAPLQSSHEPRLAPLHSTFVTLVTTDELEAKKPEVKKRSHSFSGYISGHYTLKYPQLVKKLILISPIGIRPEPEEEKGDPSAGRARIKQQIAKAERDINFGPVPFWIYCLIDFIWTKQITHNRLA